MLSQMKIGPRLMLAFLSLVAIAASVGGVGLLGANKINDKADSMYKLELMGLSHIKEANISLISVGRARSNYLLATSEAEREKHLASIHKSMAATQEYIDKARPLFVSDRAKEIFVAYAKTWEEYEAEMQRAIGLASKQSLQTRDEALTTSLNLVREKADTLDGMMSELTEQKESRAKAAIDETTNVFESSRNWII
ncbi:MAG: MCP four helix bundle domain-containing protein, partial [Steroidobacteraceae bacterium]